MATTNSRLEELIKSVKQQRDELSLKIHLGQAEAKDEWAQLQKKLAQLEAKAAPIRGAVGDTAKSVGSSLELAAQDIKKGFDRIRKMLG